MRRPLRLIAFVFTAASCAANPDETNERGPDRELVTVGSQDGRTLVLSLTREDYVTSATLPVPRDRVWQMLPAAYAAVGLPAPAADRSIWTVAVQNHTAMRDIGGVRMSHLLECGMGLTGQYADNHRINISVRTWIQSAEDATAVRTRVEATASSVQGRAGSFPCSSSGELEKLIAQALLGATGTPRPSGT